MRSSCNECLVTSETNDVFEADGGIYQNSSQSAFELNENFTKIRKYIILTVHGILPEKKMPNQGQISITSRIYFMSQADSKTVDICCRFRRIMCITKRWRITCISVVRKKKNGIMYSLLFYLNLLLKN